jgi:hypothetical protein
MAWIAPSRRGPETSRRLRNGCDECGHGMWERRPGGRWKAREAMIITVVAAEVSPGGSKLCAACRLVRLTQPSSIGAARDGQSRYS